jgi:uroporphyrinogen decarboxylase
MDISPSVYEHAAFLIGKTPWEVSRDGDLIFEAHAKAYRMYQHAPIMPGIDIYNLEAEAYGATVEEPAGVGIPGISTPILSTTQDLTRLKPLNPKHDGRIPVLIGAARRLADEYPEANIRVPVSGPFSIASNLVGFETLLFEVATNPQRVADALMHLVDGQVAFAEEVKLAGVEIAFFESAACPPLLSPAQFRRVELPALKAVIRRIGEAIGRPTPCIIGGNTEPILDEMLETGSSYLVCPFETDQEAFMKKIWSRTDVRVRVNSDAGLMSRGAWEQIQADADRIVRLVQGRPNVCMGTGALPYETRPENVLSLMEYVRDQ